MAEVTLQWKNVLRNLLHVTWDLSVQYYVLVYFKALAIYFWCVPVCAPQFFWSGGYEGFDQNSLLINLLPRYYPPCQELADLLLIHASIKVTRLWKYKLMQAVTAGSVDLL